MISAVLLRSQRVKCRRSAAREILSPPGYSGGRAESFSAEARAKPELAAREWRETARIESRCWRRVQFPALYPCSRED